MALANPYNPLKVLLRKGTEDDPYVDKTDSRTISKNIIYLDEIPSSFDKVQIDGYFEVIPTPSNKNYTPASNEYIVDYNSGFVTFNESENNKSVTAVYRGKGIILTPASRIYYEGDDPNVVENLQDLIDQSNNVLQQAQSEIDSMDSISLATRKIWASPLPTYNDILTTYPTPDVGLTVQSEDTGNTFRWNGNTWQEIETVNTTTYSASRVRPVVYVIQDLVTQGIYNTQIRFPFDGTIYDAYASCGTAGSSQTVIQIEKCSADVYDTAQETWTNIFSTNLTLDAGKKSSLNSAIPYVLDITQVAKNDHFRVNVSTLGDGLRDLTIELMVQV